MKSAQKLDETKCHLRTILIIKIKKYIPIKKNDNMEMRIDMERNNEAFKANLENNCAL